MQLFAKQAKAVLLVGTLIGAMASSVAHAELKLNGSGASFPAPLYNKWFKDYSKKTDGVRVDYQSKGSGAGIKDFIKETVDFAASDAAMKDKEIAKVKKGVILLPMTAGEVVLSYNLNGVKTFKSSIGAAKSPAWPKDKGTFVKSPKNDGVTATIKQTPGAIGYIEYGFAKLTKSPTALLQNQAGNYIVAGGETGAAALATTAFPEGNLPGSDVPDLRAWSTDPTGKDAYPIASFTWLLVYKEQGPEKAKAIRDLIEYMVTTGQESSEAMGYIPLPKNVIATVRETAKMIK